MAIQLWDLAGQEEDRRFSPYCWRAKLSLWHKGLDFTTIPWRFTETERLAFSGQGAVPVLQDGDKVIANSWDIATYLEDTYPERPSLFGGASGRAVSAFVSDWAENAFNPALGPLLGIDVWRASHEKDKAYYRKSREARVGHTLEQGAENRETKILPIRNQLLAPLRATLSAQPFIGGAAPLFADYAVFGIFQWARCVSAFELLTPDDPIAAWRGRVLDLFGGLPRQSPAYGS
ncbi:MAG: glutathione S-transferase N-terminal domain-containing protein [Deltaproteobacteria bacterium]|nr:glutathione S-transferase N-terminal domain-containing protein [Deltaproteobacteria bacterium]